MEYKKLNLITRFAHGFVITLCLASCSLKPVIVHNSSLYIGGFESKKTSNEMCTFSSVKGVGIRLAPTVFSLGYFDHNMLRVNIEEGFCESDIAVVNVMLDSNKHK